jgi:hypothetical protein
MFWFIETLWETLFHKKKKKLEYRCKYLEQFLEDKGIKNLFETEFFRQNEDKDSVLNIQSAFCWEDSKQGHTFWRDITRLATDYKKLHEALDGKYEFVVDFTADTKLYNIIKEHGLVKEYINAIIKYGRWREDEAFHYINIMDGKAYLRAVSYSLILPKEYKNRKLLGDILENYYGDLI